MTAHNEPPEKMTIDHAPATASHHQPQPFTQFYGDIAADIDGTFPALPTITTPTTMTMIQTTTKDDRTTTTKLQLPRRPTATANTPNNSPPWMQATVQFAHDAEDDRDLIITTKTPMTSPTPLPAYHISDSSMNDPTTYHSATTINWFRTTFAAVSKALDRLEIATATLYESLFAATSPSTIASPPMPPTPDPKPHCRQSQPQPSRPIFPNLHHIVNIPNHDTTHTTKSNLQRRHQNPYPQQTTCHRNHTKHRHFLCPPLPSPNHHVRNCPPVQRNIRLPTYHRYLAHNFQPP